MTARPRIGVTADLNAGTLETFGGDEPHHFLNARYTRAVAWAGGEPWLLPAPEDPSDAARYVERLDGLLLTGCGRHTDPKLYGEPCRFDLNLMPEAKQAFEIALFLGAYGLELPVLAVCGGMQSMNVALGGTLIQRIGEEVPGALPHMQESKATNTVHEVTVAPGSRLARSAGAGRFPVNSSHTQSVNKTGDGLRAVAHAPDGVIEAVEAADGWCIGVQWHPEYLYADHPEQGRLLQAFVAACRG